MKTLRFDRTKVVSMITSLLLIGACAQPSSQQQAETAAPQSLIPQPVSLTQQEGAFELKPDARIVVQAANDELIRTAELLAGKLRSSTGFGVQIAVSDQEPEPGSITFALGADDPSLGSEGYELTVDVNLVKLEANEPAGIFRGIQTVRQLMPAKVESETVQEGPWTIPAVSIKDQPVYAYRGVMLDVSRHFFPVDVIKRYIDLIAAYKMNALHLHLSDDQGWRVEIKSWPKLTEIGGSTEVGGGEGGYYTQEDYREIVRYAAERYVMIVPEIDMPGHTNAALASYAELNCDGKATELYTGIEVGFSTFCVDKEITYEFIDDVIRELAEMTPGPYIHIGGDESLSTPMEDYVPFIERVQQIVLKHGKKVVGWDEIANTQLVPDTVIQYWKFAENATMGANQGAKLLMSPATRAYLDMEYYENFPLGQHWAAYIEVDQAYTWDPEELVEGITREQILGVEAPLWSETLTGIEDIEHMAFPRLPGIAEIGWSPKSARSWDEYKVRLGNHAPRFDAMGINFYRSEKVDWAE